MMFDGYPCTQIPLGDKTRKRLEFEFHSACYHTDMEVMAGLRTSIGHLIKEVRMCM